MQTERPPGPVRIAVVGAGWAGLACAEALTRSSAPGPSASRSSVCRDDLQLTLIEAAPEPGGRARGINWVPHGWPAASGLPVDNGQHLLIGAYTATQSLLRQAQAAVSAHRWHQSALAWAIPARRQTPDASISDPQNLTDGAPSLDRLLHVPPDAGLLRLLKAGIPGQKNSSLHAANWPLSWRWSLAQTIMRAWQAGWTAQGSAESWWRQQDIPVPVYDFFWRPLIEGALNTPMQRASAAVALRVLKDSLLGPRHASDTLHPRHNLTEEAIGPIVQMLRSRGVRLVTRCRITGLTRRTQTPATEGWRLAVHATSQSTAASIGLEDQDFDVVVLALPAAVCRLLTIPVEDSRLQPTEAATLLKEKQRWNSIESLGVTTLYAALTPTQAGQATLDPAILRPVLAGQGQVAMIIARPMVAQGQVIAAVASATTKDQHDETLDALHAALTRTLSPRIGQEATARLPRRCTHEYAATWACTADQVDNQRAWGPTALGPQGLFRAADDLTPGYPACIEAAVRSGQMTAGTIQNALTSGVLAVPKGP